MVEQSDLESFKNFAVVLAREAGAIQQSRFGCPNDIEYKGSVDLVTSVDRRCEAAITGRIRDRFPDHDMVSEESESPLTGSPFRWHVDPLDGTTNYVHGYPCFSVAIALEVEGEMTMGVVYDPVRDEMFYGTKGHGAFLNGRRIRVSPTADLDHSLLATGFPYDIRRSRENNIDYFTRFSLVSQGVRQDGSAALDLCYVAMGRFDGYWEMKLASWDLAAGTLVVQEAGGRVSGFGGGRFRIESGEVLASNGCIHEQMISVLSDGKTESVR
jgi:myo-inositol-1(or 4)-monophosphatase